jgi:hypothetical protein
MYSYLYTFDMDFIIGLDFSNLERMENGQKYFSLKRVKINIASSSVLDRIKPSD